MPATIDIPTAVEFFVQHAGFSYNPATETPEQGKLRCARALVSAERWAAVNDLTVEWADDWDGDNSYTEQAEFDGYTVTTCEMARLVDTDGNVLASLGCIDDATDDYRRVIEAELAEEAKSQADAEAARLSAIVPDTYATEQIDRMSPADEFYRLKITPNGGEQGTKWLNISPAELSKIRAILARRTR